MKAQLPFFFVICILIAAAAIWTRHAAVTEAAARQDAALRPIFEQTAVLKQSIEDLRRQVAAANKTISELAEKRDDALRRATNDIDKIFTTVSDLKTELATDETKTRSAEEMASFAEADARIARTDLRTLQHSTQDAFNMVGDDLGRMHTSIDNLEQLINAAKDTAAAKTGTNPPSK